jgi:hypothetical protein
VQTFFDTWGDGLGAGGTEGLFFGWFFGRFDGATTRAYDFIFNQDNLAFGAEFGITIGALPKSGIEICAAVRAGCNAD